MITAVIRYPGKQGTHETENQFASVETKHIVVKGNSTVLHRFQEQSE